MGECDIIGNERSVFKKIKCKKCGFSNGEKKQPEIVILKRRPISE
jgi:hypothetical protein